MYITKELFVIPDGENYILFAPLKGAIHRVTARTIADLRICAENGEFPAGVEEDTLIQSGILMLDPEATPTVARDGGAVIDYAPTSATIFPTNDCNLRCVYCFAEAGMRHDYMTRSVARHTIDELIKNATKLRRNTISISFHGSGESFFGQAYVIMKDAVAYAKAALDGTGISARFSVGTNGVLSDQQREWAVTNLHHINISLDGPPDIQDAQRPLANGLGSSEHTEKTIRYLESRKFPYGIRATVTSLSVHRMRELVDYFRTLTSLKSFHIEPLFECGRCATNKLEAPNAQQFATAYVDAYLYAQQFGIDLFYSGGFDGKMRETFCGAANGGFCVTAKGDVTSCFEVSDPSDPRTDTFFIGKFDHSTRSFKIDASRLATLRQRTVHAVPYCADCFLKYSCAGDCPAKSMDKSGRTFLEHSPRCETNRTIGAAQLIARLNRDSTKSKE